jgi:hypothetical protein
VLSGGGTLATMSDDRPDDEPSVPPLAQRAPKVPLDDEGDATENPDHSALVAEIVARDKSLLDRLAES